MINFSGSLVFKDYLNFLKKKKIINNNFSLNQVQPSSVDLTLSEECYEINASFLSPTNYVRDNLKKIKIKKINLTKKFLFKKNKTFLIKLNETLDLKGNFLLEELGCGKDAPRCHRPHFSCANWLCAGC